METSIAPTPPPESQMAASERLAAELAVTCGHLNVLHAQLVRSTVDALATTAWGGVGITSPEHWLTIHTGLSPARARHVVAIARRWHELPVTMAAFAVGELAIDQVLVIVRSVRASNDAVACRIARRALVSQLSHALRRYRYGPEPRPSDTSTGPDDAGSGAGGDDRDDEGGAEHPGEPTVPDDSPDSGGPTPGPADPGPGDPSGPGASDDPLDHNDPAEARALAPNRVWFGHDDDGRYRISFDLDPLTGALVDNALREARNALFNARRPHTWSDALVEMAARSVGSVTAPQRRDLYRVYLHLDTEGAWINNGPAIPAGLLDTITCDGTVVLLTETNGRPVNSHAPTPTIPNHLRRLVLDRDRHCRFPGCARTTHLEVHHVIHRAQRGPTSLDNLAALCPHHHDLIHRRELRVTGNPDQPGSLVFTTPGGQPLHEHRPPTPPGRERPAGPPPGHRWRHPPGERFHEDCVHLPEPPPHYRPPPGDPPHTRPAAA